MGKSKAITPPDEALPVTSIYISCGIGDGGREEVLCVLQDFKKLRRRSLSGFLEHNISGNQSSMRFYHLQVFLRISAVSGPIMQVKGVAVTLKHRVNWSTSQGFGFRESGHDFLTSTNIVFAVNTISRGGLSHEACCSLGAGFPDRRLSADGGESFCVQQCSSSVHRKREESRVSPADLSLSADSK